MGHLLEIGLDPATQSYQKAPFVASLPYSAILDKDQPIANLSLVQLKIENTGNKAIREEDYARPIKFIFPSPAQIVEAVVLESSPPNVGMAVQTEQNTATLSPVLLNEKDRVIIRFLLIDMPASGDKQPFQVDARIAEVKDIRVVGAIEQRMTESVFSTLIPVEWVLFSWVGLAAFAMIMILRFWTWWLEGIAFKAEVGQKGEGWQIGITIAEAKSQERNVGEE